MDKFIPKSPDKFLKKDADATLARFGHLNEVVENLTTTETQVATNTADIATNTAAIGLFGYPAGTKIYKAILTSGIGTNPPTVVYEIFNNFGQLTWDYGGSLGVIVASSNDEFTLNKTTIITGPEAKGSGLPTGSGWDWLSEDELEIITYIDGSPGAVLENTYVEILVFP